MVLNAVRDFPGGRSAAWAALLMIVDEAVADEPGLGPRVSELRAALAADFLEGPTAPLPDLGGLKAALLTDGFAGARGYPRSARNWRDVLSVVSASMRSARRYHASLPRAEQWLAERAEWLEQAEASSSANKRVFDALEELSDVLGVMGVPERLRVAADSARERRRMDKRREFSDAARARSRFQGYAVLDPGPFCDTRARWLYVLLGQDGALYCGSAVSLRRRLRDHRDGEGAAVTSDTRQAWRLLHAERFPLGQGALCAEFALLHSERLQDALLAAVSPRARRLHARHGCAVPWLSLSGTALAGAQG